MFFTSFWIVSLTPFNDKPESSRDLAIFKMASISSFDMIRVVVPKPKIFLPIPASAANAAAVSTNGIKTLLDNSLIQFFNKGNPVFYNGPRSLPWNPFGCIILDNWAFDNIISVDELF